MNLLHVFSTFGAGGAQVRFVTLAERLGPEFSHTIVSGDGDYSAAQLLPESVRFELLDAPPKSSLRAGFGYARLLRQVRPHLLQTYNWGAMDAVAAGVATRACPVIHTEDGFGPDEARALLRRRVWARRVLLRFCRTVFPSQTLLAIAREQYRLPERTLHWIPNGIDTVRFDPRRRTEVRQQLGIAPDALVVGTVGRFRAEKRLEFLIRAFAAARLENACLLLVGEGDQLPRLLSLVGEVGIASQTIFTGPLADTAPVYGVIDVFAMSSVTEQMPMALLEAMSSGLPAVCTAVGDTAHLLSSHTRLQVQEIDDLDGYTKALGVLAGDRALRSAIGAENRVLCLKHYTVEAMVDGYRKLYRSSASGC